MKSNWVAMAAAIAFTSPIVVAQSVAPAFNLTGVWTSAGGGTFQIFQDAGRVTVVFVGPDFAQRYQGVYLDATRNAGMQMRVTRASGCETEMRQTITAVSADVATVRAVVLDSNCDLVKGQVITDTISREF